jgi:hypothetical protein
MIIDINVDVEQLEARIAPCSTAINQDQSDAGFLDKENS